MIGCEPRTASRALIEGGVDGFRLSPLDENRLKQLVAPLVDDKEKLLIGVLQRIDADRGHH